MEFLKVMEKFDGGNFPDDENETVHYNEKVIKAFALLCEHLTYA
jgi:hypothetical protein